MRKLATIRRIKNISPIAGKDKIALAQVDGWNVIIRKEDFNVGDKAVYIEIDSVLPKKPEFSHLASKKYRIKTMRMAGCISQGILFPMSILNKNYEEGTDVTDVIGVKQYVPDMDSPVIPKKKTLWERIKNFFGFGVFPSGMYKFPTHIVSKTDQERIQNIPYVLRELNDLKSINITEKLDGMSATYLLEKKSFGRYVFTVCSRNYAIKEDVNSPYWRIAYNYNLEELLKKYIKKFNVDWVCIQGEIVGEKIQNNKYGINGLDFYVFNIIDNCVGMVEPNDYQLILKILGSYLNTVPKLPIDIDFPNTSVEDMLKYANGVSVLNGSPREGIVVRDNVKGISFKVISNEFLLKYKL